MYGVVVPLASYGMETVRMYGVVVPLASYGMETVYIIYVDRSKPLLFIKRLTTANWWELSKNEKKLQEKVCCVCFCT
ncbi:unnamed protein product [Gongylonema pulchrum]|uniref:Transmembrane protein n=1 Tax=Gongylonema pulchrum TaxID=637853 RepID=A0A183E8F3_9BILA|nr:unnamed protein product [Gongylonema pulchrum]